MTYEWTDWPWINNPSIPRWAARYRFNTILLLGTHFLHYLLYTWLNYVYPSITSQIIPTVATRKNSFQILRDFPKLLTFTPSATNINPKTPISFLGSDTIFKGFKWYWKSTDGSITLRSRCMWPEIIHFEQPPKKFCSNEALIYYGSICTVFICVRKNPVPEMSVTFQLIFALVRNGRVWAWRVLEMSNT